jgi:hypothetical protein
VGVVRWAQVTWRGPLLRPHVLALALAGLVLAPKVALAAPPRPAITEDKGVVVHIRQAERERVRKPAKPSKRAVSRRSITSRIPLILGIGY